jgi:hypothetical protein
MSRSISRHIRVYRSPDEQQQQQHQHQHHYHHPLTHPTAAHHRLGQCHSSLENPSMRFQRAETHNHHVSSIEKLTRRSVKSTDDNQCLC